VFVQNAFYPIGWPLYKILNIIFYNFFCNWRVDKALAGLSRRFYERMVKPAHPVPTFLKLMAFRMGRTSRRLMLGDSSRDYTHFKEKGRFESHYYYPTRLGALKKLAGNLFDWIGARMTRSR
jgi:hypothetical protein